MSVDLDDKFTKRDLLALPHIEWSEEQGWWDSLLIAPTRERHDSGFAHIAIIGVALDGKRNGVARKILAMPDDIQWPAQSGISGMSSYGALRTDAFLPGGVLRLWSSTYEFSTSAPVSSVEILIRPREDKR